MDKIMVSVVCITYNHEDYIRDALNGFLSQKVNFNYEIIVHDDASTDKTVEIIQDYERRYPDMIRTVYQKENQYSKKRNFQFLRCVYGLCKGKYIAFCEGDDFWIDKHKLQIQIDFMEKTPRYVLTAHNAIRLECGSGTIDAMDPYCSDKMLMAEEIIMQYHGNLPTASMVIKTDVLLKADDLFWEYDVGDWMLQLSSILKGDIYYFDRIMSMYRSAHKGSWSIDWRKDFDKTFSHCIGMIDFLEKYRLYALNAYDTCIISRIQGYVYTALDMVSIEKEKYFLKKCIQYDEKTRYKHHVYVKELMRVFYQIYDEDYFDKTLMHFIEKYKHILLFGAGDYAQRMTKQLMNKNVDFDGFVVSELKNNENKYLGKPVWDIEEIPFVQDDIGVIISIKPTIWKQLVESLKNRIKNYICPFLFECDLVNI